MPEYHAMRALELVREAQSGRVSAQELAEHFCGALSAMTSRSA